MRDALHVNIYILVRTERSSFTTLLPLLAFYNRQHLDLK
jgi:hypothetical protein